MKINCDGAYSDKLKLGLVVFVVRDHTGVLVDGKISFYSCSSPIMVEAKVIYDASVLAASCIFSPVIIESGKVVLDAISLEASLLPWDIYGIIDAIRDVARKVPSISYSFMYIEANEIAHWVASNANFGSLPLDWIFRPPPALSRLLLRDLDTQGIG